MTTITTQEYQIRLLGASVHERKICSTRTRKSTFVGRSSPNHYGKAVKATTQGVGIKFATTIRNYRVVATKRTKYSKDL